MMLSDCSRQPPPVQAALVFAFWISYRPAKAPAGQTAPAAIMAHSDALAAGSEVDPAATPAVAPAVPPPAQEP